MTLIPNDYFNEAVKKAEEARDLVPERCTRVRPKTFAAHLIRELKRCQSTQVITPDEIQDDDMIVYVHKTNLGTRKYPDVFTDCCWYPAKDWTKGPATMSLRWLGIRVPYYDIWVVR